MAEVSDELATSEQLLSDKEVDVAATAFSRNIRQSVNCSKPIKGHFLVDFHF